MDAESMNEPISSRKKSRSETILMGQQGLREMKSDMHYDDSQNVKESPDSCLFNDSNKINLKLTYLMVLCRVLKILFKKTLQQRKLAQ